MTRNRNWFLWVVVALAVVGSVVLFGRNRPGRPFDPRSTKANGAKALVLLLEQYGVTVDVTASVPEARAEGTGDRLLVLVDHLSSGQHDAIGRYVDAGGVLVVADPSSSLAPTGGQTVGVAGLAGTVDPGLCTITALRTIEAVRVEEAIALPIRGGDTSCFGDRRHAYVVAQGQGDGTVVAVGGGSQWTNHLLADEANAGLATMLLAPQPTGRVALLTGDGGGGDEGLFDLVPNRVWFALGQIGMGFGVLALWRARRLGRVVAEEQPVTIAGSELVVASGRILDRIGQPARAAEVLRRELVNDLASRFGSPRAIDPETLDAMASTGGRIPPGTVLAVLHEPVADERALVALASRIDAVRREVL